MLDLRSRMYLAINRTGGCIWPALVTGAERGELVQRLVEKFDLSREQAVADLDTFLAELSSHDMLEPDGT